MKTTRLRQRIHALERERRALLPAVLRPGPMVPGGLVERWIICGKASCRCATGERHGPYYYRSVLKPSGPRLEYLGKGDQRVVSRLKRYQVYQRQMARLNALHRALIRLLWQLAEPKLQPLKRTGGGQ